MKLKESKWRVRLASTDGPAIEKVVDAPSQDVAISRVMRSFPGKQFPDASASQLDAQTGAPSQAEQPNALPVQPAGLQGLQQVATPTQILQAKQQAMMQQQAMAQQRPATESIDSTRFKYPYSITLPAHFRRILLQTSPVRVLEANGQYHMILESEVHMNSFLISLKGIHDRKSVRTILSGLRSSSS